MDAHNFKKMSPKFFYFWKILKNIIKSANFLFFFYIVQREDTIAFR